MTRHLIRNLEIDALGCGAGVGKYRSAVNVQCDQHNNTDPDDERRKRFEIVIQPVSPIFGLVFKEARYDFGQCWRTRRDGHAVGRAGAAGLVPDRKRTAGNSPRTRYPRSTCCSVQVRLASTDTCQAPRYAMRSQKGGRRPAAQLPSDSPMFTEPFAVGMYRPLIDIEALAARGCGIPGEE